MLMPVMPGTEAWSASHVPLTWSRQPTPAQHILAFSPVAVAPQPFPMQKAPAKWPVAFLAQLVP